MEIVNIVEIDAKNPNASSAFCVNAYFVIFGKLTKSIFIGIISVRSSSSKVAPSLLDQKIAGTQYKRCKNKNLPSLSLCHLSNTKLWTIWYVFFGRIETVNCFWDLLTFSSKGRAKVYRVLLSPPCPPAPLLTTSLH